MPAAHETVSPAAAQGYGPPIVVELMVPIKALAFAEPDGGYSIVVPELPGCVSQGETLDEARAMIADAAGGWLAAQHDANRERAIRDVTEPSTPEAGV